MGEIIELSQFATENTQYVTNSEQEVYEEILQEITVEFRINGTIKEAVWIHDGYFFNFTYEGKESIDYVKEIIKSIK